MQKVTIFYTAFENSTNVRAIILISQSGFFCNLFAGQQVSQNEFDNEYGTMSMGVGRFFQDFDDYQIEDEAQAVNETIPISSTSMLW